jgi:hypothetical protein
MKFNNIEEILKSKCNNELAYLLKLAKVLENEEVI